jgi:hypothetical protein
VAPPLGVLEVPVGGGVVALVLLVDGVVELDDDEDDEDDELLDELDVGFVDVAVLLDELELEEDDDDEEDVDEQSRWASWLTVPAP